MKGLTYSPVHSVKSVELPCMLSVAGSDMSDQACLRVEAVLEIAWQTS